MIGGSLKAVERAELRSVGTHQGVKMVRIATNEDIAWVGGMGGYVPGRKS